MDGQTRDADAADVMTRSRVGDKESANLMTGRGGRGGPFHAFVQHFNSFFDFLSV